MSTLDKSIVLILVIFSLIIYGVSMPPTIFWQDAGIYATGIYVEGNVYSPGFPLYMILGNLWKHIIPIEDFTQKIQWLSVIFSAVSSLFLYKSLVILFANKSTLFKKITALHRDKDSQNVSIRGVLSPDTNANSSLTIYILSFLATVAFQLNYNVWSQANNIEVYAFHTLFVTAMLYLVVKIGEKGRIEKVIDSNTVKYIYLLAITYGLSFGNHPMTVVLLPTFIILVVLQPNILFHKKTIILSLIIFVFAAFSTYAYLPVTANSKPILNWGNPNTLDRFISHVSGKTYLTTDQSFVFNDISRYQAAWQEFVWEYSYLGILLALTGLILIYRENKTIAGLLTSILSLHVLFAVFYKQTTEYNYWLVPAHIATIILITLTAQYLISLANRDLNQKNYLKLLLSVFPLALFVVFLITHISQTAIELDRRQYYYAEDFGKNIIRNLDQNSLIFLTGDQESSTIMYLQIVKKYRTDLTAIKNIELEQFASEEGRELLKKNYPNLVLPDTTGSKLNIDQYLNQVVNENLKDKSVYLMSKKTINLDQNKFYLTPAASLYKVSLQPEDIELKHWNFEYHDPHYYLKSERPLMSLKDPSKPGGVNRVQFIQHMINYELQSWKNLGDWYLQAYDCTKAEDSYSKIKSIAPDRYLSLPQIQQSIDSCYDKNR
jgi:hypothetical protein